MYDEPFWTLKNNTRILHFSFLWNDAERKQIEDDVSYEYASFYKKRRTLKL